MFRKLALIFLTTAVAAVSMAQGMAEAPTMKVTIDKKTVKPGGVLKGEVLLTFASGLHGYQNPPSKDYMIPVTVKLEGKAFKEKDLKVTYPVGNDFMANGESAKVYEGTVKIPFTLKLPAKPGKYDLDLVVGYQQCNESSCWPPAQLKNKTKIELKK